VNNKRGPGKYLKASALHDAGPLLGLLLLMAFFAVLAPGFLSERNLVNILQQSSINACVALGMTLVIISGGIDLSVGSAAALSGVTAAALLAVGLPLPFVLVIALLVGVVCGLFNGVLVAYVGLQPFIVTLGTLSTYRAIALIATGGEPIFGLPTTFRRLFNSVVYGIPTPVMIVAENALWRIFVCGGRQRGGRLCGGCADCTHQNCCLLPFWRVGGIGIAYFDRKAGSSRADTRQVVGT